MAKIIKPLSPSQVQNAKPKEAAYKLRDGNGLYLLVSPNSSKAWRYEYRRPVTGQRNTVSMGTYPEITLSRARERLAEARRLLAEGCDPGENRKAQRQAHAARAANSLEVIAREYQAKKAKERTEGTASRAMAWMEQHVFPLIGARPIEEIEAPELLTVLQRMVKRGTIDSASRVRAELSGVFCYAIATGRANRDPAHALRHALPKHTKIHFASMTRPDDIADLLKAIDGYMGDPLTMAALKLSPMLFQRPGELRGMEWAEVKLDVAEWRIPAKRQKLPKAQKENPRTPDHVVPLSVQAVSILRELNELTGRGKYVFPGRVTPTRPMSENTVRSALRRLGYTNEQITPHGFRHMASSQLNELGWNPDAIERQLSHRVAGGSVRATYNQAEYLPERRELMQAWADRLDALRTGSNVVPIGRKRA